MNIHERYKRNKSSSHPTSTDGFIGGGMSRKPDENPFRRNLADRPKRARIDDFKQKEGFHPTGRTGLGTRSPGSFERSPNRDENGQISLSKPKKAERRSKKSLINIFGGRRIVMKAMTLVFLVGIVSAGYLFGRAFLNAQQTFGDGTALQENIDRDGRVNIMILGIAGEGHSGPDLTDTIMLASIDPVNHEAALVSIPRDLYVSTGPYGGYSKINSIYANAKNQARMEGSEEERAKEIGLKAAQVEVSEATGVPVHYYVLIDFKGFEKAIDIVGGVTINVPPELTVNESMSINGRHYRLNVPAGPQQFDGFKALAFSRSRMTSPRGDFDRSERQRLVMVALKDKVFSAGTFANPIKVSQLMDTLGGHVRTSLTGLDQMGKLYEIGTKIEADKIESIDLADRDDPLITTANMGGLSVVIPRAGLEDYSEIHALLRSKLRDGFLKREDAKVAIYNATDIGGLATLTANDLKASGFTVGDVEDYPAKGRQTTIIVDVSEGENSYTKKYLEKRFGLKVSSNLLNMQIDAEGADFIIILGLSEQARLKD